MQEYFPFSIGLSWKGVAPDEGAVEKQQTSIVFPKGNPIPSLKTLIIYKPATFSVDAQYVDATCSSPLISTYTVNKTENLIINLIFFDISS